MRRSHRRCDGALARPCRRGPLEAAAAAGDDVEAWLRLRVDGELGARRRGSVSPLYKRCPQVHSNSMPFSLFDHSFASTLKQRKDAGEGCEREPKTAPRGQKQSSMATHVLCDRASTAPSRSPKHAEDRTSCEHVATVVDSKAAGHLVHLYSKTATC